MGTTAAIVMTTVSAAEDAARLGAGLVEGRLAACVQELAINSRYRWEAEIRCEPEILLLIKTSPARATDVVAYLTAEHPYDVPEVLVVEASGGSVPYLRWIADQTDPGVDDE